MLVIDAANVVGSRPTGWWRDRAGAARAFVEQVRAGVETGRLQPPIVVVLEGKARQGVASGLGGEVTVVHTAGSGDDALVDVVASARAADSEQAVTLVTADRELQARAEARGASIVRPGWLLERLEV